MSRGGSRRGFACVYQFSCSSQPIFYGAPIPEIDADRAALQGTWEVVESVVDGDHSDLNDETLTFDGDQITDTHGMDAKETDRLRYQLDSSSEPRHIDMVSLDGAAKGTQLRGIYRLQDDRLTICYSSDTRPTEFASPPNSEINLLALRKRK